MYTNEGGSARRVIIELYEGLKNRYVGLGFSNEYFEMDFIGERAWLQRAISQIKSNSPPFPRDYIDYFVVELCKMEEGVLKLEKELAAWRKS